MSGHRAAARKASCVVPEDVPSNKRSKPNKDPDDENPQADGESEDNIADLLSKKLWSDDPTIILATLVKLANRSGTLGGNAMKNSSKIFSLGGHSSIVGSMRKHTSSRDVQLHGCYALKYILCNTYGARGPIGEIGGIEVILGALKKFPNDQELQKIGLSALSILTSTSGENRQPVGYGENRQSVVKHKGIPLIVLTMRNFPEDTELQYSGFRVFTHLCEDQEHRRPVIDGGGLVVISEVIQVHPDDHYLQHLAQKAWNTVFD
jgi:hypothetical protein